MAVWTQVKTQDLNDFMALYPLGRVLSFKGIAEGVENSNYFLQTEKGDFILTLYEKRVVESDLPFFLALMKHLAQNDISAAPVAQTPIGRNNNALFGNLAGRPAAVITFLPGLAQLNPSPAHCALFGAALANLHQAQASFLKTFENPLANKMGAAHWADLLASCKLDDEKLAQWLGETISTLQSEIAALSQLPSGIIHADCFPDNVLFDGQRVRIIDFYFACCDTLTLDIAIALNAWCWQAGVWHRDRATALLQGYSKVRPLTAAESAALPLFCAGGAVRFLLTRLIDQRAFDKNPAALVSPKDPAEYLALLRFHQKNTAPLYAPLYD